jgi:hypothetical protein
MKKYNIRIKTGNGKEEHDFYKCEEVSEELLKLFKILDNVTSPYQKNKINRELNKQGLFK